MAFSPWQAGTQKGISLPANLPTSIPTSLPNGWADTPIPDSPYTHGLGGQTPNSIYGAVQQTGQNFKDFPGKVAGFYEDSLNNWKNGLIKYGPPALMGMAGLAGVAGLVGSATGAFDNTDDS